MKLVLILMSAAVGACVVPPPATSPMYASAPAADVAGRYASEYGEMELYADGTALMGGQPGRWTAGGPGTIVLHDGVQSVTAAHAGDRLTIETPNGPVVFVRGAAAPAPAVAAGNVDTRLVGCWEDVSMTGTGNGSSSYQRTVRLAADGRYTIHAYTSVSAGELSTSDEDREDGSWSADSSALLLAPRQASPYRASFRLDGGILYLGRDRFVPCS